MRARLTVVRESCPVCGSRAEHGQGPRDAVQIRCPRCGPFIITGTALAMIASRLDSDERLSARVSHAIRSATSEEHLLEIDSTSVDKLMNSRLPPVDGQIDNFLKWMSYMLGDDGMGLVELPENIDQLAGVVGAVDGERIEALISAMQKEGLIEHLSENRVRLTMSARDRLDQSPRHLDPSPKQLPTVNLGVGFDSEAEAAFQLDEIIHAHCPRCGPHRKADVLRRYIEEQPEYPEFSDTMCSLDDYRILKCRGCEAVYIQKVGLLYDVNYSGEDDFNPKTGEYSERFNPTTTYWPAPSRRVRPLWLSKINNQVIRGLLEEVYEALDADLRSIAAMGIRAALDKTFELAGG